MVHDVKTNVAGSEEDSGEDDRHAPEPKVAATNEGECGQEAQEEDGKQYHELAKVLAHLLQARNQRSPIRTQAQDGADARDEKQGL